MVKMETVSRFPDERGFVFEPLEEELPDQPDLVQDLLMSGSKAEKVHA